MAAREDEDMKKFVKVIILAIMINFLSLSSMINVKAEAPYLEGLENVPNRFEAGSRPDADVFIEGLELYSHEGNLLKEKLLVDLLKVDFDRVGEYEVIYYFLYVDSLGNEKRYEIDRLTVSIYDETKPVLHGVKTIEAIQNQTEPIDFLAGVSATDNDKGSTLEIKVFHQGVDLTKTGLYPISYFVSDNSGNYTTAKTYVYVKPPHTNPTTPLIELTTDQIYIQVGTVNPQLYYKAVIKAYDGTTDITEYVQYDDSNVNYNVIGTYQVMFIVFDADGNFDIKPAYVNIVNDTTPPEFINLGDTVTVTINTTNVLKGIKAYDQVCGDVTSRIKIYGTIDFNKEGYYNVVFEASDPNGNVVQKHVTVHVTDNLPPTIEAPESIYLKRNGILNLADMIKVTDNYDTEVEYSINMDGLDATKVGAYFIHINAKDKHNNISTKTITVYVYGTEPENLLENPIIVGSIVAVFVTSVTNFISFLIFRKKYVRKRRIYYDDNKA